MNNKELIKTANELSQHFESLKKIKGTKLNMALIKNMRMLETEMTDIKTTFTVDPVMEEFHKERLELCKKLCRKDEAGEPVIIKNGINEKYDIDEESAEWIALFGELMSKYKGIIDADKEREATFQEFLKEESEVEFKKVNQNDLPGDLDFETIQILDFMIRS